VNVRIATGVDLVSVGRLRTSITRTPGLVERVFTEREVADATRGGCELAGIVAARRLAARFAAKEATRKCFGEPRRWRDIEVRTDADGAPSLWLRGARADAAVSLSHEGDHALAFVVAPAPHPAAPPGPGGQDAPRR
jgi:holo-[acyl-carrier protein] synthase